MEELTLNLHIHTCYSDGEGSHADVGKAGLAAGLDVVLVTDHNVWVPGMEGYYHDGSRRLLMLVGEEIHDQARQPHKSHLLVFGAGEELAPFAPDPQILINKVRQTGGLAFIAHPNDPELAIFGQSDISWVDWQVHGFTGIELWNGFSELKSVIHNRFDGLFYAFFPDFIAHGPLLQTLKKWDDLLSAGKLVVAVGGSDAHALTKNLGPIKKKMFPYEFHFRGVNTHLITPSGLTGDLPSDRRMVLDALKSGNVFIGYDLPCSSRGFRFSAQGAAGVAEMGQRIAAGTGVTFQVHLPEIAETRLLKDGKPVRTWRQQGYCTYIANHPGVYRVESYLDFHGSRRGWIFSNPIFVTP